MMLAGKLMLAGALAFVPGMATAQGVEAVGMRALGMGGAFVAVADDASATYWNPAGLVTGSVFSAVAEAGRGTLERVPLGGPGGSVTAFGQQGSTLVALGTWPLGATFYRLSDAAARVVTVPAAGDQPAPSYSALQRLTTTHAGVNVLQTIVSDLHVGATLKYVYGSAGAVAGGPPPDDPLDAARDLPTRGNHRFDMDVGAIANLRRVKLGLTVRNVLEPEFDTAPASRPASDGIAVVRLQLPRQVRAGAALRASDTLLVSLDADLTRTPDVTGERRSLAAGAEQRFWGDRAAVRGGFRVSTAGNIRPVVTTGGSVSLRSGIFADGYVAIGLDQDSPDGFGAGVRVVF